MHSKHVRFLNNPLQFKIKNQNAVAETNAVAVRCSVCDACVLNLFECPSSAVVRAYSVSFGLN